MEKKMYSVQIGDEIRQYEAGTTYRQIAAEHQKDYEDDIVLVFINDRLQELHKTLEGDCVMRFETTSGPIGHKTYKRSMSLMLVKAVYDEMCIRDRSSRNILFRNLGKFKGNQVLLSNIIYEGVNYVLFR